MTKERGGDERPRGDPKKDGAPSSPDAVVGNLLSEDGRQKATDKVTAIATPTTPTTTTSKAASGEGVEKGPKDGSGSFDETKKTTTTANDDLPSDVVGKSSSSSSTTKATPTSTTTIN